MCESGCAGTGKHQPMFFPVHFFSFFFNLCGAKAQNRCLQEKIKWESWLTCGPRGLDTVAHLKSIPWGQFYITKFTFYIKITMMIQVYLNIAKRQCKPSVTNLKNFKSLLYNKCWQIISFRKLWGGQPKPICWPDLSRGPPAYMFWFKCKKWNHKSASKKHMPSFLQYWSRKDLYEHNQKPESIKDKTFNYIKIWNLCVLRTNLKTNDDSPLLPAPGV